jgi:hypothetical protein
MSKLWKEPGQHVHIFLNGTFPLDYLNLSS